MSPRWGGDERSLSPTPRTAWAASPNSKDTSGTLTVEASNSHTAMMQQPETSRQQCSGDGLPGGVCIYGGSDGRCEPSAPVVHIPLNKARVSSCQSIHATPQVPCGAENPDVTLQTDKLYEHGDELQAQQFQAGINLSLSDSGNGTKGGCYGTAEDTLEPEAQFHHLFTGEDVRRRAEAGRCFLAVCLV